VRDSQNGHDIPVEQINKQDSDDIESFEEYKSPISVKEDIG